MKLLIIDNYDSFTYNILELLRSINCRNVSIVKNDQIQLSQIAAFDKIILSPGPGLPSDYPILDAVIQNYKSSKPILGVCLGHQAIAMHFGSTLTNLPDVCHGQSHDIQVDTNAVLYQNIPSTIRVGLYHSWAVDASSLPSELHITSVSDSSIVMSISHSRYDLHGIQFHPESFLTPHGATIMKNFLNS
jgi:anthranilate synthase component II